MSSQRTSISFVRRWPMEDRRNTQADIVAEMRRRLSAYPSYRPSITSRNALGSGEGTGGFAIAANILGPDLNQIAGYSKQALLAAQKLPSLADVKITLNVSNPEVHVAVDRKRAADLGVRMATIGNTLRLAVAGDDEISFFKEGPGADPVKMRVLESQRGDIAEIGRLTVPAASGRSADRQHRDDRAWPRTDDASALGSPVRRQPDCRRRTGACARRSFERRATILAGLEDAADDVVQAAGAVEDPGRDDSEPGDGHQPRDDLRLHGAGGAVRELPAARRHHAGNADRGALRAVDVAG